MVEQDIAGQEYDLAIVGGGIAGPALAAALADTALRVALIERSADPLDTARGDHLQPVTCEFLDRWGLLDLMLAKGAEKRLGSRWQMPNGELVMDAPVDDLPIPHPYFLYLNHERISEAFLERAADNPHFSLLRPARASVIENGAGPGIHSLAVNHDGRQSGISARCIALADGRSSRARRMLGIDAQIHDYENPLLILFARRSFDDPRNEVQVFLTRTGVVSVVPRIGDSWKIGFPVAARELAAWTGADTGTLARRLVELVPAIAGIERGSRACTRSRWSTRSGGRAATACCSAMPATRCTRDEARA